MDLIMEFRKHYPKDNILMVSINLKDIVAIEQIDDSTVDVIGNNFSFCVYSNYNKLMKIIKKLTIGSPNCSIINGN